MSAYLGKKKARRESKSVSMSGNGQKISNILIISNFQKGPASKNDAKINPGAKK